MSFPVKLCYVSPPYRGSDQCFYPMQELQCGTSISFLEPVVLHSIVILLIYDQLNEAYGKVFYN